jgi:hypothetical protein
MASLGQRKIDRSEADEDVTSRGWRDERRPPVALSRKRSSAGQYVAIGGNGGAGNSVRNARLSRSG